MKKAQIKWKKYIFVSPICFILGLFPLLVCRFHVRTYTEEVTWLPSLYRDSDFFLFIKMIALLCIACFMVFIYLFLRGKYREKVKSPMFILLLFYGGLVLISSFVSEHPFLSFRGVTGMLQGAVVVVCYLIVFFYSVWWSRNSKTIQLPMKALLICILVMGIIGVSQLFGFDLLSMEPVRTLLGGRTPKVSHFIYLTLFHWNYVGSYVALVLPIVIAMMFYFHREKRKKALIFSYIAFYLLVFCLCGSQSRTGMIGVAVALVVGGILYRKKWIAEWKRILPIGVSVLLIALFCNWYITGSAIGKWDQVLFKTKGSKKISSIETEKNALKIGFKGETIYAVIEGKGEKIQLELKDEEEKLLGLRKTKEVWRAEGTPYEKIEFEKTKILDGDKTIYGFQMNYKKGSWIFTNQHGDGYYYVNPCGKMDKMIQAETALPSWMNEFASLRGFVWSRTLPTLKEYVWIGAGADQFGFVFPHQDYAARYKYDLSMTYYKKPHNWYLQTAVESGCFSAVIMIVFWGIYLRKGWKSMRQKSEGLNGYLKAAIWFSVLGYLVTAIFNDSFLTVAPVFWCLAGIGVGIRETQN